MKRTILGALIGGILFFLWQFLSWTVLNTHEDVNKYTPQQDSILQYLGTHLHEEGTYFLPTFPPGTSREAQEAFMQQSVGKPWAVVAYHKALQENTVVNIIRELLVDIVMVWMACFLFMKMNRLNFGIVFLSCLFIGLIGFFSFPYSVHIWYETSDIMASFKDAIFGWGIVGIWLGIWLKK